MCNMVVMKFYYVLGCVIFFLNVEQNLFILVYDKIEIFYELES